VRVRVYVLGGHVAKVTLVGSLALSEGRVVIEAEDPRPVGTLANIRDQPIRVRKDEEWIWYSAHEQPEEFLRSLHRMSAGAICGLRLSTCQAWRSTTPLQPAVFRLDAQALAH
jgi:hypothetical protein